MYSAILTVHSYLRYAVLLLVLLVVVRYVAGLLGSRAWNDGDEATGRWMIRVWDLQFLLGLVLYFLSPIVQFGFVNFGQAMGDVRLRQFLIEHPLLNLLAIAVLHVGWIRAAKAADDRDRMVRALVFIAVAVVLVVLSIPWSGRPLLRTTIDPPAALLIASPAMARVPAPTNGANLDGVPEAIQSAAHRAVTALRDLVRSRFVGLGVTGSALGRDSKAGARRSHAGRGRRVVQLPLTEVTRANSLSMRAAAAADRGPRAKEATLARRWSTLPVPDSTVLTPGWSMQ